MGKFTLWELTIEDNVDELGLPRKMVRLRKFQYWIVFENECLIISGEFRVEGVADVLDEDDGEWDDAAGAAAVSTEQEGMCPAGTHRWKHEQCMICTICRECTGYGSACISALRPDRNPGQ